MTLMRLRVEHFPLMERRKLYKNDKAYKYTDYREEIREDCKCRCVYCDVHEEEIGGDGMFQLDHFRPQKYFPHLVHEPTNLVYSCSRCNLLKRDNWTVPDSADATFVGEAGFIDVFQVNRREYFQIVPDGTLQAYRPPAKYLIELLALNRSFLQLNRLRRFLVLRTLEILETKELSVRQKKADYEAALLNCSDKEKTELYQSLIESYDDLLALISDYVSTIEALF